MQLLLDAVAAQSSLAAVLSLLDLDEFAWQGQIRPSPGALGDELWVHGLLAADLEEAVAEQLQAAVHSLVE